MSQVALGRHISAQLLSASRSATYGGSLCGRGAFGADRLLCVGGKVEPDAKVVSTRAYRTFTVGIAESSGLGKGIAGVDMASRGPASLEARMLMNPSRRESIRAIRREPISQAQRNAELEEEAKRIDLAPHKLLEKGEPDTMQAIIKDVIPVGYFLTLPNGRDGYLPALDLGFTGGIVILERLFKVGQELTVRVVRRGGGGREILSMKKPEFAPNTDPRFVFSERGGFGNSSNTSGGRS